MDPLKINTPTELRAACCLNLCYSDEQLAEHLPLTLTNLLAAPQADAIWCLAGLLPTPQRQEWAYACARRAKEYAAAAARAADAASADDDTASAADWAADAARAAARAAVDAAVAAWAANAAARADDAAAAARAATSAAAAADWVAARAAERRLAIRHAALLLELPE